MVSFSVYVHIFILSKGSPQKVDVSAINGTHYFWETSYLKEADLYFSHFQQRHRELDHLLLNDIFLGKKHCIICYSSSMIEKGCSLTAIIVVQCPIKVRFSSISWPCFFFPQQKFSSHVSELPEMLSFLNLPNGPHKCVLYMFLPHL